MAQVKAMAQGRPWHIVCNLKSFKRLLLSKLRLEVQALEFLVTINLDCIATKINTQRNQTLACSYT